RNLLCFSSNQPLSVDALKKSESKEEKKRGSWSNMTITPTVRISGRKLVAKGRTILTEVPENVLDTAAGTAAGVFLGAQFEEASSRQVTPLGTLRDVRFMACFRFKLWWMAQKVGESGREIPLETQFLLVESDGGDDSNSIIYTVFLPLIDGPFRACFQGNGQDVLELCLESGDPDTKASSFTHSVFVSGGTDPFTTITDAFTAVKLHLKTFRQRQEKQLPGILDCFGWCTWDAFYQEVTQEGVEAGLASLSSGGSPPKFVIIDDGWQSVAPDQEDAHQLPRLTGIKENHKFQKTEDDDPICRLGGINNIARIAKDKFGLKYVYVWHAITGYWGGVKPGVEEYGSLIKYPLVSKGVMENEPSWKTDPLAVQGLGLVNPKSVFKFYSDLHGYLAANGIDGVKVDVQCILETLGAGHGGRVELTRQYHHALDASIARNFADNGCIACMSHNTDAFYLSKQTAVVRASDDFYPRDPISHTIHIASVAYNSVFLGELMQPDWDMFHSQHPAAEYHGSARAISGGPIYVSDAPGKHNFELLRKLVLPDGSILRARLAGRPTKDCLFTDPARDGLSLLKIWNMNKYNGVLGVYNCQGAAWSSTERKNAFHETSSEAITGGVKGSDVHLIAEAATDPDDWNGDCVAYCYSTGRLTALPSHATLPVSLKVLEFRVFNIAPVRVLAPGLSFAPLGLIGMFNGGGAVQVIRYDVTTVVMEVKGCGKFGAYSATEPRGCSVGSREVPFGYDLDSGLLTLELDQMPDEITGLHIIEVDL
ncbi:hypothetical protein V2J09_017978, partial [Rumex salicifolius]